MRTFKYAGPPGTGKSTTLLNVLDRLLASGVASDDIVFTTFTRAGANEARDRAVKRFSLSNSRLPYFKTLHALCFGQLDRSVAIMGAGDWCAIAKSIGVFFSVKVSDEGIPRGSTKGDALLSLWSLARVLRLPLREVWNARDTYVGHAAFITFEELEHFVATVQGYKSVNCKVDYTDMLELFISEGHPVSADYIIVDEAQDLSPLQWAVVEKLCAGAKEVHIAGDDDQAIHEWNGAAPQLFIDHPSDEYSVLPQSFRIPKLVHTVAEKLVQRITNRLPKEYNSRAETGAVQILNTLDCDRMKKMIHEGGTWFMLARNHGLLPAYSKFCREQGIMFTGLAVGGPDLSALNAIKLWKRLQQGGMVTKEEGQDLYNWMSTRDRIAWGSKTLLSKASSTTLSHELLVGSFGLLAPKDMHWTKALDRISPEDAIYFHAIEKKGDLEKPVAVEIATIHAVKGREADNVVIMPDMIGRTYESFLTNPDAEHRVWYVAVTRARNRLVLIEPSSNKAYNL